MFRKGDPSPAPEGADENEPCGIAEEMP